MNPRCPSAAPSAPREHELLLVDDHADTLESMGMLLRMEGYRVTGCTTGHGALQAVEAGLEPDVVLMDINLPDISGLEVARQLRDGPHGARRRLVAVSGWSADAALLQDAGPFDRVLTKPVDLDELLRVLAGLLAPAG